VTLLLRYWWLGAIALLLVAVYSFGHSNGADSVQAKWDAQRIKTAEAATEYFNKLNDAAVKAREETEQIRQVFIDYKAGKQRETDDLERAVADRTKRLSVRATCPGSSGVPSTGTLPGGASGGTPELTADAGRAYWNLRRGLDQQYGLLQFCRAELRKRSK
jgi:hypothetical protein